MNVLKKWSLWLLLASGLLATLLHFSRVENPREFSSSAPVRLLMAQKVSSHVILGRLTGSTLNTNIGSAFGLLADSGELKISRRSDHFILGAMIVEQDRVVLALEGSEHGPNARGFWELVAGQGDLFDVVLHQELEPYVAGVVMAEMKSHWPIEALKAQAVCARSYAWFHVKRHRGRHYDLWGNSRSQAFSRAIPSERVMKAVEETKGEVLSYDGKVVMPYYISTCGGQTRKHLLEGVPYSSVQCGECEASPHFSWEVSLPIGSMKRLVSKGVNPKAVIKVVEVIAEDSGHAKKIHMIPDVGAPVAVDALIFRRHLNRAFGKELIKSLVFSIEKTDQGWTIKGNGWGYHGRGMCQYGAKGFAVSGEDAASILQHYYPQFSPLKLR